MTMSKVLVPFATKMGSPKEIADTNGPLQQLAGPSPQAGGHAEAFSDVGRTRAAPMPGKAPDTHRTRSPAL